MEIVVHKECIVNLQKGMDGDNLEAVEEQEEIHANMCFRTSVARGAPVIPHEMATPRKKRCFSSMMEQGVFGPEKNA